MGSTEDNPRFNTIVADIKTIHWAGPDTGIRTLERTQYDWDWDCQCVMLAFIYIGMQFKNIEKKQCKMIN